MHRLRHRRCGQKGFTFNELLVAMSLVAVAVMGLSIGVMSVLRGNRTNDNYTAAVNLAQDHIERLRSFKTHVEENRCPASDAAGISAAGTTGGIFHLCWKIERSPLGRDLKQIEVTVSWREQRDRELTLSTLVFSDGGV
jgi:prepilin-type N-terminal cleavage/methylation domain-containing protein